MSRFEYWDELDENERRWLKAARRKRRIVIAAGWTVIVATLLWVWAYTGPEDYRLGHDLREWFGWVR